MPSARSPRSSSRAAKSASSGAGQVFPAAAGTVFLAEKHSIAKALADVLPGRGVTRKGYIECGETLITWLSGHLLEDAPPEAYNPAWKKWSRNTLPIVPDEFRLVPRTARGTAEQLEVIRRLLQLCPVAVNAGDFDREGQLLVDEVLQLFHYKGRVLRLQTKALDARSLRRELDRLAPNENFRGMRDAARARSQLDWLAGINLTRAMTLHGKVHGASCLLSLGRVQTPTLALVVERDLAIEQFQPKPFYKLECPFTAARGVIETQFVPAAGMAGLDEAKRLIDRAVAESIRERVSGKEGVVQSSLKKLVREAPPLPYNLTELQKEASARYGMGAQATLAAAQALYEAKVASYPRTDCQYLPAEQFSEAREVLAAIAAQDHLADMAMACDLTRRSAAWNTSRVTAHHAIIPTAVPAKAFKDREAMIYDLICRRYAWQFLPEHVFYRTRIDVACEETLWRANGRIEVSPGWTEFKPAGSGARKKSRGGQDGDEQETKDVILPEVADGEPVQAGEVSVTEAKTAPPPAFTEGTLIDAMENIQRYMKGASAEDQNILKKTEGLGTVATRAGIIAMLLQRSYLEKKGKTVCSTQLGRELVAGSPTVIKDPLMTAEMERSLSLIQTGELDPDAYVKSYAATLPSVISEIFACKGTFGAAKAVCPDCGADLRRARTKKGTWFWVCSNADCGHTAPDRNGTPGRGRRKAAAADENAQSSESGPACPRCGRPLKRRAGHRGAFWGCSGFPSCLFTANDLDGQPQMPQGGGKAAGAGGKRAVPAGKKASAKQSADVTQPVVPDEQFYYDEPPVMADEEPPFMPENELPPWDLEGEGSGGTAGSAETGGGEETLSGSSGTPPLQNTDNAPSDADAVTEPSESEDMPVCPRCGRPLKRRNGRRGVFWGCSGFPSCWFSASDQDGRPVMDEDKADRGQTDSSPAVEQASSGQTKTEGQSSQGNASSGTESGGGRQCPRCGRPMVLRKGPRGPFWGCSAFPSCRGTANATEEEAPSFQPGSAAAKHGPARKGNKPARDAKSGPEPASGAEQLLAGPETRPAARQSSAKPSRGLTDEEQYARWIEQVADQDDFDF